jgi:metallopeptidase MepB
MRVDVYQAKVAAEKNLKSSGEWERLTSEARLLVEKMVLDGKRAGLGLPEEQRNQLGALQKELQQASLDFTKNYNEENVSEPCHLRIEAQSHLASRIG